MERILWNEFHGTIYVDTKGYNYRINGEIVNGWMIKGENSKGDTLDTMNNEWIINSFNDLIIKGDTHGIWSIKGDTKGQMNNGDMIKGDMVNGEVFRSYTNVNMINDNII